MLLSASVPLSIREKREEKRERGVRVGGILIPTVAHELSGNTLLLYRCILLHTYEYVMRFKAEESFPCGL